MALVGPWGTFYHIPKCGGMSLRYFLKNHYHMQGVEVGNQHSLPPRDSDLTNGWTVVRHPAEWLLSYYSYCDAREWVWNERPQELRDLTDYAAGMFWPMWVKEVTTRTPGMIGQAFGLYCVPGIKVYRMEEMDSIYGEHIHAKNEQEIKPVMTRVQWDMICETEKDTLERYGYDNTWQR